MAPPAQHARQRPAQIADVARLAGVSPATVSRTLSNPSIVTAGTRERVMAAEHSTGYTPNIAGRNLRARRTNLVLVVVPDIANPFFSDVLHGIDEALSGAGYGFIIGNLDNRRETETRFVDLAFAGLVDGVLLLNGRIPSAEGRTLADSGVPVIAACEAIPDAGIPQIVVNNREAAREAVLHLAHLGHRRIGYIAGPPQNILEHERAKGFRDGQAEAGLKPDEAFVFPGAFTFRSGAEAAQAMLALPVRPTAIFAANDEMAIGFLKCLHAAGINVPDDLSIVGFDDIDYASYCEPSLTTQHQPKRDIGVMAANILVDLMKNGQDAISHTHVISTRLLIRASTARCKA